MSHARIFLCFKTSPEITLLALMMYVRFSLSLRNVEDLHERGIDVTRETARFWRDRSGAIFAAEIRRNRVEVMRDFQHRCWLINEVFVRINGAKNQLCRAVGHEGEAHWDLSPSLQQVGLLWTVRASPGPGALRDSSGLSDGPPDRPGQEAELNRSGR